MPVVTLTIGSKLYEAVDIAFRDLGRDIEEGFDAGMRKAPPILLTSLQHIADKLAQTHGAGWNGRVGSSSPNLQSRSGDGLKSIRDSIAVSASNGQIVAGTISAAKLSFHEEGGTIRASGSGYLTIPLPAAMDARGVPLRSRARAWDFTFVKRSKKGNLIIFRRIPGARELTPLYILKTSVYIKPRLRMEPAVNTEMGYFENKLFEEISDTIDKALPR